MPNFLSESVVLVLSWEPGPNLQAVSLLENPQVSVELSSASSCESKLYLPGLLQNPVTSH